MIDRFPPSALFAGHGNPLAAPGFHSPVRAFTSVSNRGCGPSGDLPYPRGIAATATVLRYSRPAPGSAAPRQGAVGVGRIVLSIFLLLLFPAFLLKYQSPALFMRKLPVVIVHAMLVVIALLTVCTPSQPDSAGYHLWLGSERYEEALLKLRQEYDDASRFRDQAVGFFSGLLEKRERPDPTGGS